MSSDDRISNLLFMLTLCPLAIAGCPGRDSGTNDASSTTGTGDGGSTASGTTDGPQTADAGTTDGGTTDAEPTGDTTAGRECDPDPGVMLPTEIDPLCTSFAEQLNDCYYDGGLPMECFNLTEAYCQYNIDYSEEACSMAWMDLLACLTPLSCEELASGAFCRSEDLAESKACGKGEGRTGLPPYR